MEQGPLFQLSVVPPRHSALLCRVEGHLQGLSDINSYNTLHIRMEGEWLAYCTGWQHPTASGT
jgi:hypothetical protein